MNDRKATLREAQKKAAELFAEIEHRRLVRSGVTMRELNQRSPDENGRPRDWILEVHLTKPEQKIGAFFEQLLTVD